MSLDYELIVTADPQDLTAEFRLQNTDGAHVGYQLTDFRRFTAAQVESLFDLRNHTRRFVPAERQERFLAELGVVIAKQVLGDEIFSKLWASQAQRTVRIQLPAATQEENHLAAGLARLPWEIARPSVDDQALVERNLLVRVVHDMAAPATPPLQLGKDETLRALFVFGAARQSRPLAARRERRELRGLFEREIYPKRRVVADFLTHGVTRERLEAQVRERGGYHIVHWSGHGHMNLVELAEPNGDKDLLTGEELLDLFASAGGFIPRLFFLSACHSGDISKVRDWESFLHVARGGDAIEKDASAQHKATDALAHQPGFTGTAHALLAGGTASVVAMRFSVGDDYALDLGVEFYRALLAFQAPQNAAAALMTARQVLRKPERDQARFAACDHATPILYGTAQPSVTPPTGRSPADKKRSQRLHKIEELTVGQHANFVGRTWELAGLETEWFGVSAERTPKPVASVIGLGGMGKTALAAETLDLCERSFDWVALYQAKPSELPFENLLRDLHLRLVEKEGRYYKHVQENPGDAIFREAKETFTGQRRYEILVDNLVQAMRDEMILLVIDNFETNLRAQAAMAGSDGEPLYACKDPVWDLCLSRLAEELQGYASRVLITCRRPLAALSGKPAYVLRLGPLSPGEAALFLRDHGALAEMVFHGGPQDRELAQRLITASRFHPLLMDRLARLAAPQFRPQLKQAVETLERREDFSKLPALFAIEHNDSRELAYLKDALAGSIDQLIEGASVEARRLLWVVALANEPVHLYLLTGVWSGEDPQTHHLRHVRVLLENLPELPPQLQQSLSQISTKARAELDALPSAPARPDPKPLLRRLEAVGLVDEARTVPKDENPTYSCHEVVRERIRRRMQARPEDRGELGENAIRLAYAGFMEIAFESLQETNMSAALEAGARAIVYFAQAEAYDRVGHIASTVVTGAREPRFVEQLLPHLAAAAAAAEGTALWIGLLNFADALRSAGRSDKSLALYEQAAAMAQAAREGKGSASQPAAVVLAVILANWANALSETGRPAASRAKHLESAKASLRAGRPILYSLSSELQALNIDVMQGKVTTALPEIEARLVLIEGWWKQSRVDAPPPEAPDREFLNRAVIGALNVALQAYAALRHWEDALACADRMIAVEKETGRPKEDIARSRFNRAASLRELTRFEEAKRDLEYYLDVFANDPVATGSAFAELANVYSALDDNVQAVSLARRSLKIQESLPDTESRVSLHANLATYLERLGGIANAAESARHMLAGFAYGIVARLGQPLQTMINNCVIDFQRAAADGRESEIPLLAELLADPAFNALKEWLEQRKIDPEDLQKQIDALLVHICQAAQSKKAEETPNS